jgi:hypothetical protein
VKSIEICSSMTKADIDVDALADATCSFTIGSARQFKD